MTFIISEDEALRDVMKGMTVSDNDNSSRAVGVWFGQPDMETRDQAFPFVTIDLVDISEGTERVMSGGRVSPWYYEDEDRVEAEGWSMPYPVPVNLDYQITTFARHPRHDRQILAQILGSRLPLRYGSLTVIERITEEEVGEATIRRLDMLGHAKRDTVDAGKRLFMNMFTVRVSSEMPAPSVAYLYTRVQTVDIARKSSIYPATLSDSSLTETLTISAPVGTP